MSAPATSLPWRGVILTTLLPTGLYGTGRGAILPVIPVIAVEQGASLGAAGLISAMLLVGGLIGDLPSGAVVTRVGERAAMIWAAGVTVLATVAVLVVPHPVTLAIGATVIGIATSIFALARHAFLTTFVPPAYRARALSTLGGTFRLGMAIGPFITAGLLSLGAGPISAFWVLVAGSVGAALVLLLLRDPEVVLRAPAVRTNGGGDHGEGLFRTIAAQRGVLVSVGISSSVMSALRASRQVILPLWAVSIGVSESWASVVIGVAMALDFALFYTGGWVTDRLGRRYVAIPSLIGLAVCHLVLALSHDLPGAEWWFVAVALALALANGMGAGMLMTLGSDLADPEHPASFLAAWRFVNDTGQTVAPLAIAAITAAASLPIAALVVGAVGLAGAAVWLRTLPNRPVGGEPTPGET